MLENFMEVPPSLLKQDLSQFQTVIFDIIDAY